MTDRYAVIGNPIGHSKSPLIHGAFALATGQDIAYTAIEGPLDGFRQAVDDFRAGGGRGMNVTAPFKLQAFELATECSDGAQRAGAVNALRFDGERILLLGAGGASRGALRPFLEQQPAELVIANRTATKARALAQELAAHGSVSGCGTADLARRRFDIVINATSASQTAELPDIAPGVFGDACLAYELVYGKGLTPFLQLARSAGAARLADGVGMLVEQAAEAFVWWRGVRPDTRPVIDRLTIPLV